MHRYHEAAQNIWHFFWDEFCDWYLEIKKLRFVDGSGLNDDWKSLLTTFETGLRLLHPVMPFLSEELSHRLDPTQSISLKAYPAGGEVDSEADKQMAVLQEIIVAARNIRAERKIDRKQVLQASLDSKIAVDRMVVEKLAGVAIVESVANGVKRSTPDFDLIVEVPQESAEQVEAQRTKLAKEIEQLEKVIANSERQLSNEEFMSKAPEKVVSGIREKLDGYRVQIDKSRAAGTDRQGSRRQRLVYRHAGDDQPVRGCDARSSVDPHRPGACGRRVAFQDYYRARVPDGIAHGEIGCRCGPDHCSQQAFG
jgi:valyl-tRNA synthetase